MRNQPPKFRIEQLALCPTDPNRARRLLADLGLDQWFFDDVHAMGVVRGVNCDNHALLQFNYQGQLDAEGPPMLGGYEARPKGPLELEILHYSTGHNWMTKAPNTVSHLGMHCTEEELESFREYFVYNGIGIAQEVYTQAHTNPAIKDSRRYHYAIFDTREILGVDLKFIVRREIGTVDEPANVQDSPIEHSPEVFDGEADFPEQRKSVKKATKSMKFAKATKKR